ncbi:barstar family protein [Streptomyces sp. NPDC057555]|uniref:barstar family protein n=1 Tax=Streptomyces sp. NPDC057555 TaxID=3346166 RepID=UPI0036A40B76
MILESGLKIIRPEQAHEVMQVARSGKCPLYEIATGDGSGREAFFDATRSVLPLDPPVVSSRSWNALSDSLWEGIYSSGPDREVILWSDATIFFRETPGDFQVAMEVLADVAELLADESATRGRTKEVCIYVGIR